MKIEQSYINLQSNNEYSKVSQTQESIKIQRVQQTPEQTEEANELRVSVEKSNELNLNSSQTMKLYSDEFEVPISEQDKIQIRLIENFLKQITGKECKLMIVNKIKIDHCQVASKEEKSQNAQPANPWSITINRKTMMSEKQSFAFHASGNIITEDQREISLNFNLNVAQSKTTMQDITLRIGEAVDPLVINYASPTAELTAEKFSFDLNSDGTKEDISFLEEGSGFLALDKNKDGKINDGRELFGPESGNGFLELSAYDEDGNGWIDESDSVFDQLQIWSKTDNGEDMLASLYDKDIGAIYLGNVSTQLQLQDDDSLNGLLRQTGIYLHESGTAGTLQHIDLMI